ncbi:MAG: PD-(D/E)XK nuclease family protein [Xanthomonadales bacterium]
MTVSNPNRCPDISIQVLNYESLFSRLQAGHTLITGNSRLSRVLAGQYSQWRINLGDHQWQSPAIVSWNLWLDQLWEAASLQGVAGTGRAVPGSQQLISLWENILRHDPLAWNLLRPESLARQLRDTRRLISEWQLDLKDPGWLGDDNENHSAFHHWNQAFEKRCHQDHWIPPEDRTALLCVAIRNSHLSISGNIDLLGFDEFNPSQSELLTALIKNGNTVSRLTISPENSAAALWQSRDSKNELQQMARWVRYWFEQEPDSTIAIVVPDLQARRQEVERCLEEILTPGINHAPQRVKPWNISLGVPLARVPMIETAFELLKLLDKRIDIQDVGRVLRSPWFQGGVAERNSRALLEKCLRDQYPRQLKLSEIRYRSSEVKKYDRRHQELPEDQHEPQVWNSPKLTAVLNKLMQFERNNKGPRPASAWAEALDQLLANLGWPLAAEAESKPSSTATPAGQHDRNWQALQAWRDALRVFASLDTTLPKLGCKAAINRLQRICRERIFQAHTPPAPIQVLGLYEVSGLRFDHLWVLGLHNANWPPGARPNPFIPGRLQREAQLPNSSPQRELKVARTITQRLLETAPDCVFSFPGQLDGEAVLASPLLTNMQLTVVAAVSGWQGDSWQTTVAKADKPQLHPLLMPGRLRGSTASGGSSILKHQALCPFRAFASNRLGADRLGAPVDGISPMLHGSLVHSVLEYFWQETKSQAALLQLDEEGLSARVRKHVDRVINDERGLRQRPALRGVESDRLCRQLMDYLALEKAREAFEVTGFEQEILPQIEGQTIRLSIDRIDKLPSGEEVIIDYKTGQVAPRKWFGDRPEDPQLPLYAISANQTPAAVVFAIIRDDGCLYQGVVGRGGLFPDLPPRKTKTTQELVDAGHEMPKTIESWRQVLHRLMADFLAGEAAVDPKDGRKTCADSYCELHSLCRIGELEQIQKAQRRKTPPEAST